MATGDQVLLQKRWVLEFTDEGVAYLTPDGDYEGESTCVTDLFHFSAYEGDEGDEWQDSHRCCCAFDQTWITEQDRGQDLKMTSLAFAHKCDKGKLKGKIYEWDLPRHEVKMKRF